MQLGVKVELNPSQKLSGNNINKIKIRKLLII